MDLAKRIKDQLASVQNALSQARTGVGAIRGMVAEQQREREIVRSAAVPRDEAVVLVDTMLDRWRITSQEHAPELSTIVGVAAHGERPQLIDPYALTAPAVLRLVMLLLGDQVRAKLIAELDAFYATTPPGLPRAQRERRLQEIDRELTKLEAAEEAAIAAAEEGGLQIDRRPDAAVEAILGLTE